MPVAAPSFPVVNEWNYIVFVLVQVAYFTHAFNFKAIKIWDVFIELARITYSVPETE